MNLLMFPDHIIDDIVLFCEPGSLVALAQTSRYFRHKINRTLYSNIAIENETDLTSTKRSVIGVRALPTFVKALNSNNFRFVNSISINVAVDDFFSLYEKILKLWDACPDHCIRFNASPQLYLFPKFICQDSVHYAELEDSELVLTERHRKMNNLHNWTIGDVSELRYMPFNPNLQELALDSKSSSILHPLNERSLGNLHQIDTLVLSLDEDINALANLKLTQPLAKLKSLTLTNSHSLKKHLILTAYKLSSFVNLNQLEHLKLNISCSNQCHCVAHLLSDIALCATNLKSLQITSNVKDPELFHVIASSFANLQSLESLWLCLDEFGLRKDPRFSFKVLSAGLGCLDDLEQVYIHDIHHYMALKSPLSIGSISVSTA